MNKAIKLSILIIVFLLVSFSAFATDSDIYQDDKTTDVIIDNTQMASDEMRDDTISLNTENCSSDSLSDKKFSVAERRSYDPDLDYTFGLIPTKDLSINFASHLYLETAMLYGYPTIGGTLDFGINVDTVTIAAYLRYHHFFRPLGSKSGSLYIGEELGEVGLSFKVRIYELGRFNVNIGINTGWYQQWLMYHSSANTYNLVNNGMIIRPEASIGWNWIGWWTMELGLFYQTPLYPTYEGYQGWGLYLKLL